MRQGRFGDHLWEERHAVFQLVALAALVLIAAPTKAQIQPSDEALFELYPVAADSPYSARRFPSRLLFGDSHLR
jgi:hypothetical protein